MRLSIIQLCRFWKFHRVGSLVHEAHKFGKSFQFVATMRIFNIVDHDTMQLLHFLVKQQPISTRPMPNIKAKRKNCTQTHRNTWAGEKQQSKSFLFVIYWRKERSTVFSLPLSCTSRRWLTQREFQFNCLESDAFQLWLGTRRGFHSSQWIYLEFVNGCWLVTRRRHSSNVRWTLAAHRLTHTDTQSTTEKKKTL